MKPNPLFLKLFAAYSRRRLQRNFHSLSVLRSAVPDHDPARPLVIYLNHAAWWDPLICLQLSREFFAARSSYAPIEASMLRRYGFFKHLGFFPVDQGSSRGAWQFLRTSSALLESPGNVLWLTPQGRFRDVRERPLKLQGGLGALAARKPHVTFLPLAIEYSFWTEPRPEILIAFGKPITPENQPARSAAEWTQHFTQALTATQDSLALAVCRRLPEHWLLLNRGQSGVNKVYDAWRWLQARLHGESFSPEHPASS